MIEILIKRFAPIGWQGNAPSLTAFSGTWRTRGAGKTILSSIFSSLAFVIFFAPGREMWPSATGRHSPRAVPSLIVPFCTSILRFKKQCYASIVFHCASIHFWHVLVPAESGWQLFIMHVKDPIKEALPMRRSTSSRSPSPDSQVTSSPIIKSMQAPPPLWVWYECTLCYSPSNLAICSCCNSALFLPSVGISFDRNTHRRRCQIEVQVESERRPKSKVSFRG